MNRGEWTSSLHCHSKGHCGPCRHDRSFRETLVRDGWEITEIDFACPWNENPPNPIQIPCCKKMSVFIKDTGTVPKEGWRFPSIEGSRVTDIRVSAYSLLYRKVVEHYQVNGQEPPTKEAVDLWLCENLTVHCFADSGEFRNNYTHQGQALDWRPVPREEWPMWAKVLALLAQEGDKGIGSVVERTIGPVASNAFKAWHRLTFGRPCSCSERKERWDSQYPLP
jgi:hypothetical protein